MPSTFMPGVGNTISRSMSFSKNSPSSAITRRHSAFETLTRGLRKKTEVEIVLVGGNDFIHSYSTFDEIKGYVELKFDKDTVIDDLHIHFEGQSNTFVERIAAAAPNSGRTTGTHVFLRMQQPIQESTLPTNNLALAGVSYQIPFDFVVPDRLLPYVCNHKIENEEVKSAHLHLPPSLGDPMLAGDGSVLMDDLSPDMAKIIYAIKARVGKASPSTGRQMELVEKHTRVRIVPSRQEEPPLSVDEEVGSYCLRKEKNVRKGLLNIGKKQGRFTAETTQPNSFRLPHPQQKNKGAITTMTTVSMRFDPATLDEQPPQLGTITSKLRVYTFYGGAPFKVLPEIGRYDSWSTLHGQYPESLELSSRNLGSVTWTKHQPGSQSNHDGRRPSQATTESDRGELTRRSSNFSTLSYLSDTSTSSVPAPSKNYDPSLPFYTTKVIVPITLPSWWSHTESEPQTPTSSKSPNPLNRNTRKVVFVPTFHSCIVSRTYTLEFNLSFYPVKASGGTSSALGAPSITLKSPVQISQEGGHSSIQGGTSSSIRVLADLAEEEHTTEYDEAIARHLDREVHFDDPFGQQHERTTDIIPEYEEVQTILPTGTRSRHVSLPQVHPEQPPEYYSSPFRSSGNRLSSGRRHSFVQTRFPVRSAYQSIAFLGTI